MSYRIVDEVKALRLSARCMGYALYVVVERGGDSNLFDRLDGRRSSRWHVVAAGMEGDCLQTACGRCAACVSGSMQLAGLADATRPEDYLAAWRAALARAADYGADLFPTVRLRDVVHGSDLSDPVACARLVADLPQYDCRVLRDLVTCEAA